MNVQAGLCICCSDATKWFSRVEAHISNVDSYLPLMSGAGTKICLSNLPGLNKASSNISTLLVAASITTPTSDLKPEIMKH